MPSQKPAASSADVLAPLRSPQRNCTWAVFSRTLTASLGFAMPRARMWETARLMKLR